MSVFLSVAPFGCPPCFSVPSDTVALGAVATPSAVTAGAFLHIKAGAFFHVFNMNSLLHHVRYMADMFRVPNLFGYKVIWYIVLTVVLFGSNDVAQL